MVNSGFYFAVSGIFIALCAAIYPLNSVASLSVAAGYLVMLIDYVLIAGSVKKLLSREGNTGRKVTLGIISYTARLALIGLLLLLLIKAGHIFNVFWVLAGITASLAVMLASQLISNKKD